MQERKMPPRPQTKGSFFIDTCVFVSAASKDENTRYCHSFLSRVKNGIYEGYISPYVVGEMVCSINEDVNLPEREKRELIILVLDMMRSIEPHYYWPDEHTFADWLYLRRHETLLTDTDLIHVACAHALSVPLVTQDKMLLESKSLKTFVEVKHPKDVGKVT